MIQDHYKILDIPRNSTRDEIKKAYRKLAMEWHPDKNKSPDAHERFISINEAYLILTDEEAKSKFDYEYDYFFGVQTENAKQQNTNAYNEYENQQTKYHDENLNTWSKSARKQSMEYAKMSFKDFTNLLNEIVVETGNQGITAIFYAASGVIGATGLFKLIVGIKEGDLSQIIFSILLTIVAFFCFNYISRKYK